MDENISTLKGIGLTMYEAQAYVTLTSLIQATADEVSKSSGIPRSKIYDVLKKLSEKDFIEIEDGRPLTYVVKSPVEVLSHEKEKIDSQIEDVIVRLTNIYENGMSQVQAPIWRIYGVEKIINQELEIIQRAKNTINMRIGFLFEGEGEALIKAFKKRRNLKVNILASPTCYINNEEINIIKMFKDQNINIQKAIQFLGVEKAFPKRLTDNLQCFRQVFLRAFFSICVGQKVDIVVMKHFVNHIQTPNVLTERKDGLDVGFCRDVTFPILIPSDTDIRDSGSISDKLFHLREFHLLRTPPCLRRGEKASSCFQEMMERCRFRRTLCCTEDLYSAQIRLQPGNQEFSLRQFTPSIRVVILDPKGRILVLHIDGQRRTVLSARYSQDMPNHTQFFILSASTFSKTQTSMLLSPESNSRTFFSTSSAAPF